MKRKLASLIFSVLLFAAAANGQTAEVSVALNEQFFDALLDAIFKNFNAPEFPLAKNDSKFRVKDSAFQNRGGRAFAAEYADTMVVFGNQRRTANDQVKSAEINRCSESIRLLREVDGVKTAVRFREGRIYAPIAFSGSYNPPFIGCIDFEGWAETNIELEYNRQSRKLVGRVQVLSVNLGGAANLASSVLSRLVQSSIDKKINPIEILQTDKLSFLIPIQNADGSLRMKAAAVNHEISSGVLNIRIVYEFSKGN